MKIINEINHSQGSTNGDLILNAKEPLGGALDIFSGYHKWGQLGRCRRLGRGKAALIFLDREI
jgi:hypothetical protein